jgi:hypothetical protein
MAWAILQPENGNAAWAGAGIGKDRGRGTRLWPA